MWSVNLLTKDYTCHPSSVLAVLFFSLAVLPAWHCFTSNNSFLERNPVITFFIPVCTSAFYGCSWSAKACCSTNAEHLCIVLMLSHSPHHFFGLCENTNEVFLECELFGYRVLDLPVFPLLFTPSLKSQAICNHQLTSYHFTNHT